MIRKWKPSKSQKKTFAIRMQDPSEQEKYNNNKRVKEEKNRAGSNFDYYSAGGRYIPTQSQYDFCIRNASLFVTDEETLALAIVISGYINKSSVHHDYIHIVNEKSRNVFV
jgi:hypothetical protein